jgi:aspartyl-tRNA(Asn)/glutamyl-tRNA(Gln) amidotransferase subunit B
MSTWEAVIGLEVHVQLGTSSKAFSGSAARFGDEPNSNTDPTVLGLPGALPVFNARALEYAVRLGLAVGGTIRERSQFSRKQYFYPDLPKGYQISQYDEPLVEGGSIDFPLNGQSHSVALTRIHLEEDAGKSTHLGNSSLVDLNRAGVPLCEVVSEPDLRSAEEAAEYMRALWRLVRYIGVSEANMEKGHLRCDANVSLRPVGATEYGTRTELKNINSFRFVQNAIEHEIARQGRILDEGGHIVQETRLWDADRGTSQSMRSKEEAEDYRYFPDPDLPPLVVDAADLERVRDSLPELPEPKRLRLLSLGLSDDDAYNISADRQLADYFDAALEAYGGESGAKTIANWIQAELLRELNRDSRDIAECPVAPASLAELIGLIDDNTISGKIAKDVFSKMYSSGDGAEAIVEREGLKQITDTGAIEALVREVVAKNEKQVEQYKGGNQKIIGFFVGQVMKASQGKANPKLVNELLKSILDES